MPKKIPVKKEATTRTEQAIDRIRGLPISRIIVAIAALIAIIGGSLGYLAAIPDNIAKIRDFVVANLSHPTPTPIKNTFKNTCNFTASDKSCSYRNVNGPVTALAWSFKGPRIASGDDHGTVEVWDTRNGNTLTTYQGHEGLVGAVAWSHDDNYIASGGKDGTVQVWRVATGQTFHDALLDCGPDKLKPVIALSWSPENDFIAVGYDDGSVGVYSVGEGVCVNNLSESDIGNKNGSSRYLTALRWTSDSTLLIASINLLIPNDRIQLWSFHLDGLRFTLKLTCCNFGFSHDIAWSTDGKFLAIAADYDDPHFGAVYIFDPNRGKQGTVIRSFTFYQNSPDKLAWACDSEHIAIGRTARISGGEIAVDDISNNAKNIYPNYGIGMGAIAWSPDYTQLASISFVGKGPGFDSIVEVQQVNQKITCPS
jgi:WD40 repeat protein